MFYIYTPSGRTFAGPLEKLRKMERPSAAHATASHYDEVFSEACDNRADTGADAAGSTQYMVSQQALSQYGKMLQPAAEREAITHAYQLMSQSVKTLLASETVQAAFTAFRRYPYQLMPILNEQRELVATLSRSELYEFLLQSKMSIEQLKQSLQDVFMTSEQNVYSAAPVTDVRRIAALLLENKLDAIPIVEEDGRLVGILSRTDILRCTTSDPPLSLWC